jgi:hypothetical protein
MDDKIGIKEYSDWPTIPQLYVNKDFVGGCDILVSMHQSGELAKLLEDAKVLVPAAGETAGEEQPQQQQQQQQPSATETEHRVPPPPPSSPSQKA